MNTDFQSYGPTPAEFGYINLRCDTMMKEVYPIQEIKPAAEDMSFKRQKKITTLESCL